MKTKNKILGLLAGIACVTLGAGVGTSVMASANTDMTIGNGTSAASFRMDYGASVRFNKEDTTDDKIGIRFSATLNKNQYTELEKLEGVNYGMIIVPQDIAATNPLTKANLFGDAATYCLKTPKSVDAENGCDCPKQHAASVEYPTLAAVKGNDTVMQLRGSLVDIKAGNLNREFVGLGYIEYGNEYVLAQPAYEENTTENPDVKNNTRSMAHVAQLAIEDGQDDENNTLYNAYLKGFIDSNTQFKYTVNHYLPGETADTYEVKTETLYAALGEEVSATHVKEGNVADVDGSAYRLHEITSKGNPSGKVYASGRTVLNAYYAPIDTTLDIIKEDQLDFFLIGSNNGWVRGSADLDGDDVLEPLPASTASYLATTAEEEVDEVKLSGDNERKSVVKIVTDHADNYYAGAFRLPMGREGWLKAKENDFAYIKLHMYIDCDNTLKKLTFRSWEKDVVSNVETHKWVDVIVPLAKLNNNRTRFNTSKTEELTKAQFLTNAENILGWNSSGTEFLSTWDINVKKGLTTTKVTYYIDEVSWGIDTKAPTIQVDGLAEKMYEGTFTEPTITVTDDMALQSRLDSTVETKLYKKDGDVRTEVTLVDNAATLTEGTYEYVVTADDRIYKDEIGNVATETRTFTVEKRQDVVVTFGSATDAAKIQKVALSSGTYEFSSDYVDATTLTSEVKTIEESALATGTFKGDYTAGGNEQILNATTAEETITPVGGALKVVVGYDNNTASYGGRFAFKLENELEKIAGATSVTIRMYAAPNNLPYWLSTVGEVPLYREGQNGTPIVGFNRFTWVDLKIPTSDLGTSWINYFNGTKHFWTSASALKPAATSRMTYYINSITFDVTP